MLYPDKEAPVLDEELFRHPTAPSLSPRRCGQANSNSFSAAVRRPIVHIVNRQTRFVKDSRRLFTYPCRAV